jgi:hypothetical protein
LKNDAKRNFKVKAWTFISLSCSFQPYFLFGVPFIAKTFKLIQNSFNGEREMSLAIKQSKNNGKYVYFKTFKDGKQTETYLGSVLSKEIQVKALELFDKQAERKRALFIEKLGFLDENAS